MGAFSDLLKQTRVPAVSAVPAVFQSVAVRDFQEPQEPQEPQGVEPETRARLLALAEDEEVDAAHVHRLHADDVKACAAYPDRDLRRYLHGLVRDAGMDAGIVPPDFTATAHCDGCGPIHWFRVEHLRACPWCFRRKAGKSIPRPLVTCEGCASFVPDTVNPEAGMGACRLGPGRAHWPMQSHRCPDMRRI